MKYKFCSTLRLVNLTKPILALKIAVFAVGSSVKRKLTNSSFLASQFCPDL